jgi:Fe-S cluster biogenesis protein NfuA
MSEDEIKKAINEIRPQLQSHGGDVKLVGVEDGVVKVSLTGACVGCPMSQITLKNGVENFLKQKIPTIQRVEAV